MASSSASIHHEVLEQAPHGELFPVHRGTGTAARPEPAMAPSTPTQHGGKRPRVRSLDQPVLGQLVEGELERPARAAGSSATAARGARRPAPARPDGPPARPARRWPPRAWPVFENWLADLAMYQGRFADAINLLQARIAADKETNDAAYAATNHVMLAEALAEDGKAAPALQAVRAAIELTAGESIVVPAARLLIGLGREPEAEAIAAELSQRLEAQRRAYGKTIEGEVTTSASAPSML